MHILVFFICVSVSVCVTVLFGGVGEHTEASMPRWRSEDNFGELVLSPTVGPGD